MLIGHEEKTHHQARAMYDVGQFRFTLC